MKMLSGPVRTLLASAVCLAGACVNDGDDGKASVLTRVELEMDAGSDGSLREGDAALDAPQLELLCRKTVVTEHTLAGFSVLVRDATGLAASAGEFVAISPSTGTITGSRPGGGVTDERGIVAFSYAAPHFDYDTQISLEASMRDRDGTPIAIARCSFAVVTEGLQFLSPESGSSVGYGVAQPVSVRIAAEDVEPSCAKGGGVHIGFAGVPIGGFAGSPTDPAAISVCIDSKGGGANAQFYVRGEERGGTMRIEARTAGYRTETALQLVGAPASVVLKSDSADLNVSSAANISIKVVDDVGQGVGNLPLTLSLARCAATPCGAEEAITPTELVTMSDGTATAAYFAGDAPGAAQLTVSVTDRPKVAGTMVLRVH